MSWKSRRRSGLLVLMGTALLLAGALAPGAQARVEGFQALAPSPVELTALTTDPGTGLIYAQENEGTNFFVYNPRTNAWSELAPSPVNSENNGGATFLNGKIYVAYTENANEIAVYDIASNSWTTIDNPLEEGTGDITAGNGKLYVAVELEFFEINPATGIATPLAEPPKFAAAECTEGFESWGGLQFDGTKIYGHQGNGCNGFAVYDIPTNTWLELPMAPEIEEGGAILGSAIDPVTNTYLTSGPYGGTTLFRYDLEAGSWSTGTLPFEVNDNGMAYVGLPGIEGVYIIQGESGVEFTRYNEQNATDLSVTKLGKVTHTATGGKITYSILVANNGPERAGGVSLSDPLPAGTKLISVSTSQGTCAGTSTLTCSLGVLRSRTSASLTIKVKAGLGKFTNTATVSSQAVDANHANDSGKVVSKINACIVPKLKGLRLKQAKKKLRKAHCKPGKVVHRHSGVKKGRVVRGGKHRGAKLREGSKVKLVVSSGPKQKSHRHTKSAH
jgi:uncharacterized repeat protein (TIGR01451 family)